jgi:hypothetical protein
VSLTSDFNTLCGQHGSDVIYHRDDATVKCPCLTPEGFRDPIWHLQHPTAAECNEAGMLTQPGTVTQVTVKAFCHPVQSGAVRRLTPEQVIAIFGEVQADDHIGIFPVEWAGVTLNFYDWGRPGEDWVEYNNRRFQVVSVNLIPAPDDGNPYHHYELGLRLVSQP